MKGLRHKRDGWAAAGAYALVTVAMTWPLAAGLGRCLPNDLGDPLLNSWILHWDCEHLLRLLRGDWRALSGLWNANIFHPEPLALAYSEHLLAQAAQALPVYALTHNVILCHNLLFLSTFVLSGLGTFLFVRELTGSARAAFLAGLFYAFTPYRLSQLGHLQVLSSQWMPFVLYGLRRYFDSRGPAIGSRAAAARLATRNAEPPRPVEAKRRVRWSPLAGAGAALVAQNLSCGYFLLYFPPFVLAYAFWEIYRRGLWRDWRTWAGLSLTATAVIAATLPFLFPYWQLRRHGFAPRPMTEIAAFSADPTTYLVASDGLHLWPGGFAPPLNTEALLFPGFTPVALAAVALACLAVALRRRVLDVAPLRGWRLAGAALVAAALLATLNLARFELFAGRHIWRVRDVSPFLADVTHVLAISGALAALLLALSRRGRAAARLALASGRAFFAAAFLAAVWLSFGPQVTTRQHGLSGPTLYAWLYAHLPGFDGLRVPARFGMLAMLFLALVAGYGAAAVERVFRPAAQAGSSDPARKKGRRTSSLVAAVLAAFFLLEATGAPIDAVSLEWKRRDGRPGVVTMADLDRVYGYIRRMPAGTVVAEFPFADLPDGEARAVFLATRHGHPILNGYSGGFPASFEARKRLLQNPEAAGDAAWKAIRDSGATCLIVHEWAFQAGNGPALSRWLEAHGALPLATFKSDRLYQVPR